MVPGSADVPFFEFLVEVMVPELGLGIRFAFSHVLIVQLTLYLTVQDLQLAVRDGREIFREVVFRCQVELLRHAGPL
jgi:hypothetical protein